MAKLLGEFLQEQQEPFALDVYLLERGYCTRTRANCSRKKRRGSIPNCGEFVRAVFSRILLQNASDKIKNPTKNGCGKTSHVEANDDQEDHANHEEEFSSASATTLYNSCSESDVEDADSKAEADTNCFNLRSMEDCDEQLSPISVLEETESQALPLYQRQYNFKKTRGESSKSISQRKSKHKSSEECRDCDDQYSINKRALQQTKKLLVDCVREVIESERRRDGEGGGGKQLKRILGADELWKAVCENVWLWSQESIHESNIIHLLRCDFMASLEEWDSDSSEVSMEIGDAILEDIINEIVAG